MKKCSKIALGGVITSLCTVFNILATVIPATDYILPALSGMLVLVVVFESGYRWGKMVYFATSVLSILLCADKFPALAFITLLGLYPLSKLKIDSWKAFKKTIGFFIKAIWFNILVLMDFLISIKIFGIPEESFYIFGVYIPPLLFIAVNIVFCMYERCIDNFIAVYFKVLQPKLREIMKI